MIYSQILVPKIDKYIVLNDWVKIIHKIDGIQIAKETNSKFELWFGYNKNPYRSKGKQFHDKDERKYDVEVKIKNKWIRVFYWNSLADKNFGLAFYEGGINSSFEKSIEEALKKICKALNLKIIGEDNFEDQQ